MWVRPSLVVICANRRLKEAKGYSNDLTIRRLLLTKMFADELNYWKVLNSTGNKRVKRRIYYRAIRASQGESICVVLDVGARVTLNSDEKHSFDWMREKAMTADGTKDGRFARKCKITMNASFLGNFRRLMKGNVKRSVFQTNWALWSVKSVRVQKSM